MFCPKCGKEMVEDEGIFLCYDGSHATYSEEAMDWFGEVAIYQSDIHEYWHDGEKFPVNVPQQLLLSIRKLVKQFGIEKSKGCPFLGVGVGLTRCINCPFARLTIDNRCFIGYLKEVL